MEKKDLTFFDNLPLELEQHITDYLSTKSFTSFYMTSKNRLRSALPRLIKLQKNLQVLPNFSLATGGHTSFYYYSNKLFSSGNNKYGQLGSRYKGGTLCSFELVKEFPGRIQQVIAGGNHTFVLTEQGLLFACGRNFHGQLGLGHHQDSPIFTQAKDLPGKAQQVVTGADHTLVLTDQGLFACGHNYYGQLGTEPSRNSGSNFTEVKNIPGKIQQIIAGPDNTFVLTDQGLYTSGKNNVGQLGLGHTQNCRTFMQVKGISGQILQVIAQYAHTFVLTDQGLFACGHNGDGQLGLGNTQNYATFTCIENLPGKILQVVTETSHTFVLTNQGLFICGYNRDGQLGLGHRKGCHTFMLVKDLPGQVQKIALGNGDPTFVVTDQGLFACGRDYYFEMGLSEKFKKINNLTGKILQIVTGGGHTLILTERGLFGVGDNYHGQLGLGGHHKWGKITLINHLYAQENKFLPLFFYIEKLKEFDEASEDAKCVEHFAPRPK